MQASTGWLVEVYPSNEMRGEHGWNGKRGACYDDDDSTHVQYSIEFEAGCRLESMCKTKQREFQPIYDQ